MHPCSLAPRLFLQAFEHDRQPFTDALMAAGSPVAVGQEVGLLIERGVEINAECDARAEFGHMDILRPWHSFHVAAVIRQDNRNGAWLLLCDTLKNVGDDRFRRVEIPR